MNCDLHNHSVYSDGTLTPAQLVSEAKKRDLVIALTDHNTTAGLPEFVDEAQRQGVTAVPGIELSTQYDGRELHLLGLFVRPEHYALLEGICRDFYKKKEVCDRRLTERLKKAGYEVDYDETRRRYPNGNTNRAHIAADLVEKGYVASVKEAFATLLKSGNGFYEPPERLGLMEGVHLLKGIGAVPVLAHPLQELTEGALRALLPQAIEAGLVGMEVMHSSYSNEKIALAMAIAEEFFLEKSGGSDFHGQTKPTVQMGIGEGNLSIPREYYENLLKKCKNNS